MSDPVNALDGMIVRLNAVPGALDGLMSELGREVDAYLTDCYARGVDPDGTPWPVTATGAKPKITGTQKTVAVIGHRIVVRLQWHDALHSQGYARGGRQRRMLPAGGMPPALSARLQKIVGAALQKTLGAR